MKRNRRLLAAALLLAWLGCASGARPKTEATTAPGADLAAYASFGWAASPASPEAPRSLLDATLHDAIRTQLVEKGYREVATDPDFRVGFETAAYVAEKVESPMRVGVGMGSWGGPVGVGVGTSVPVGPEGTVASQEVRITIRAVEPERNQEVWIGSASGIPGPDPSAEVVEKAVAETLAKFPARRK
jgi:hypothetical protein